MARAIEKSCCLMRYRPSALSPSCLSIYMLQYLTLVLHLLHRGLVDKSVKFCFKSSLAHVWLRLHLPCACKETLRGRVSWFLRNPCPSNNATRNEDSLPYLLQPSNVLNQHRAQERLDITLYFSASFISTLQYRCFFFFHFVFLALASSVLGFAPPSTSVRKEMREGGLHACFCLLALVSGRAECTHKLGVLWFYKEQVEQEEL